MKRTKKPSKARTMRNAIKKRTLPKKLTTRGVTKWIPSGSIMFNLTCSNHWSGAYKPGTMVNIIGDSSAGKSIMVLSGLAEMAYNPDWNNYTLIYDDSEFANSFDIDKLFGSKFAKRIQSPDPKNPDNYSTTIEEFQDYLWDAVETGKPFVYVLDSFDALDALDELKKDKANRAKRKAGRAEESKGSYGTAKAKKASSLFRQACVELAKTKSLLIIISQTRDNLSAMSFSQKTRAGGKALKFYASIETWLTHKGVLKKIINSQEHQIGVKTHCKITKNKYTGRRGFADFPIYYDYGIDDLSACIDFLVDYKWWRKRKMTIDAQDIGIEASKSKLIEIIEEKNLQNEVFQCCQNCWEDTQKKLKLDRKGKFK